MTRTEERSSNMSLRNTHSQTHARQEKLCKPRERQQKQTRYRQCSLSILRTAFYSIEPVDCCSYCMHASSSSSSTTHELTSRPSHSNRSSQLRARRREQSAWRPPPASNTIIACTTHSQTQEDITVFSIASTGSTERTSQCSACTHIRKYGPS